MSHEEPRVSEIAAGKSQRPLTSAPLETEQIRALGLRDLLAIRDGAMPPWKK